MSFSADMNRFATKSGIKLDTVVRKVVIDMTKEIVMMTPVDTGHARSNYFWGVQRVTTIDPTRSKNGAPSLARSAGFASGVKAGGTVYLTNNLPYIMPLEFGHSKQAPAGMARITVARFQGMVDAITKGLR